MKKQWRLAVMLLALAAAASLALAPAFARTPTAGVTSSAPAPGESAEISALSAVAQRLATQTDRISLGLAQMRLNAASRGTDPR